MIIIWKVIKSKHGFLNIYLVKLDDKYEITYPKSNKLTKSHIKNMINKGYKISRKREVQNSYIIEFSK